MRRKHTIFSEIVLHVISAALKPLTAREIQQGLSLIGEEATLHTIHRQLDRLQLLGLIKREMADGKPIRFSPAAVAKFTVLCSRCGKSLQLQLPSDPYLKRAAEEATGFTLGSYSVSFDGVCEDCRLKQDQPVKKYRFKSKINSNDEDR